MKVSNGHLDDPEHPPCDRKAYALGIPHATVKEPSPSVPKSENARLARSRERLSGSECNAGSAKRRYVCA